jgi:ferredoxin-NADP reductase
VNEASVATRSRWTEATIERIEQRTPRVVSVFLRAPLPPREAGQHVDVRLTAADGYSAQRSYSIASAPESDAIELAIERLDDGEVSPYFHEVARAGDTIEVRGPIGGHFVWRVADGGPVLLVAGGSGVAPLLAMVRHRTTAASDVPMLLAYSARTWDALIDRDELLDLSDRDPGFSFVVSTTREARRRPGDYDRRFDRAALGDVLRRWAKVPRSVYVCGSTLFVEAVAGALVQEGIPAERIRTERFGGTGG